MTPPFDYESLSREERLRRIGAILSRIATRYLECERDDALRQSQVLSSQVDPASSTPITEVLSSNAPGLPPEEFSMLQRFAAFGEVTPREAMRFWSVSRTTAYRRLARMQQDGWVERHGATTATRFRFTPAASRLLHQANQAMPPQS